MGPRFLVPSDGLEKPGIEPATPGLQGQLHNHCTMEASHPLITLNKLYIKPDRMALVPARGVLNGSV